MGRLTVWHPITFLCLTTVLSEFHCREQNQIIHKVIPMQRRLILASASTIRLHLLEAAGLAVTAFPARIDEDSIRAALEADAGSPRDIADVLAEMKAGKLADKNPTALVLGCDQVLDFGGRVWGKPETPDAARTQLRMLRGKTHRLLSAVVLYDAQQPVWRHIGEARLTMRDFSDTFLDEYLDRNWESIRSAVGCYKLEEEGVRLFSAIEGDYFTILGLPLLPLLEYLGQREFITS